MQIFKLMSNIYRSFHIKPVAKQMFIKIQSIEKSVFHLVPIKDIYFPIFGCIFHRSTARTSKGTMLITLQLDNCTVC